MKKITYYLLIAVMAICFTSKVDFAQTTVTKQLDYPTAIKTYQLQSNQDLLIMVNNVRRYDVLSVEPDCQFLQRIRIYNKACDQMRKLYFYNKVCD